MRPSLFERLQAVCAEHPQRVIFAEGGQESVIRAARVLQDKHWALPELVGGPYEIRDMADNIRLPSRGLKISNPGNGALREALLKQIRYKLAYKDLDRATLENLLADPIVQSVVRVRNGTADMACAGNKSGIVPTVRIYLQHAGLKAGFTRAAAGYFLLGPDEEDIMAFADCSINVNPTAAQLAEIALHTAQCFQLLSGREARVAFLSFSTKGSARHEKAEKMARAVEMARKMDGQLICEGEIQLDAAIDKIVAQKKAPHSRLNGKANVFIFPSLNAANIAEKIVSHIAGYRSIGPVLQGFNAALHYTPGHLQTARIIDQVLLGAFFKISEAQDN